MRYCRGLDPVGTLRRMRSERLVPTASISDRLLRRTMVWFAGSNARSMARLRAERVTPEFRGSITGTALDAVGSSIERRKMRYPMCATGRVVPPRNADARARRLGPRCRAPLMHSVTLDSLLMIGARPSGTRDFLS